MTSEDVRASQGGQLGTRAVASKLGIGVSTARGLLAKWRAYPTGWKTTLRIYRIPAPKVYKVDDRTWYVNEADIDRWLSRLEKAGAPAPGHLPVGRPKRTKKSAP